MATANHTLSDYRQIADRWRSNQPDDHTQAGVVLIWDGQVYAWKNTLRDAQHERPGAVAVDDRGHVFVAEGGNDYDGAQAWVALNA